MAYKRTKRRRRCHDERLATQPEKTRRPSFSLVSLDPYGIYLRSKALDN
jgi:hypothetical protein